MPEEGLPAEGWVSMHLWYCSDVRMEVFGQPLLNFNG